MPNNMNMEQALNLSDYDRSLIVSLTESNNRLAKALEDQQTEKVFSCADAAKMIGVTPQTVSRYIREGRIKKAVRGGRVGIPESEIQKLNGIQQ